MSRFAPLLLILLFIDLPSYSQVKKDPPYIHFYRNAERLYHLANATASTDRLAHASYSKVINILTREEIFNEILSDSYLKSGILEISGNEPEQALINFHESISVVGKNPRLSDSLLFKPFIYAGSIQYSLNDLDSAVYYFKKAEWVNSKYAALDESERLFNKFGALYYETGDYNKSIIYFGKALSLVQGKKPVNVFFEINYKNNIATALMKLGKYKSALDIFEELLKYPQPDDALFYNTGNTYFEERNFERALHWVRKIRDMDFEKFTSLTKIFIRLQQYDSARFYLDQAKSLYEHHKGSSSKITYGIILKYSGDLKSASGKPIEALTDYQSALIHLNPAFQDEAISANPKSFSGLQNFSFLFETLVAKATTLNSINKSDPRGRWQEQSIDAFASALSLAKHIEKTYFSDDARLFLKTKVSPATQDAVDIAIQLYNKTKNERYVKIAFGFAEDNKATVLQAGLRNLELGAIPGLPARLTGDEKKYRIQLAKLEIRAARVKDSVSLASITGEIHNIEISLASVQDKLDENPLYHELKFAGATADMDSIREKLKDGDEAILSYYYTKYKLICFYITKEGSGFSAIPLNNKIFTNISALRNELTDPIAASSKSLRNAGIGLCEDLILPVLEYIKNKKRLVIIPYNEINYIPFEMITLKDGSMLLKRFAISYNYAASFLTGRVANEKIKYDVLAMAPFSSANPNLILPELPSSMNEISSLPGIKFFGKDASKNQFETLCNQFPVIHLATHAVANDINLLGSYIEFYGLKTDSEATHRLYEKEIYTLDLKSARLVILSACETGNGLLVNGEGVISLSRAFSYAGCKTVVTSLWKADEISTAFITKRLHHYLQDGLDVDEALQRAKLDYLDNHEISQRYKNPAFWANLVLIGDFHQVVASPAHWIYWVFGMAAVGLTIVLLKKK